MHISVQWSRTAPEEGALRGNAARPQVFFYEPRRSTLPVLGAVLQATSALEEAGQRSISLLSSGSDEAGMGVAM